MKTIKVIFFASLFFILVGVTVLYTVRYLMLPSYDGVVILPESRSYLSEDIEIFRDANAIPHIKASDFKHALYGLGYVHGVDRPWQLFMRKMSAQGRLSEVFGSKTLHIDKHIRSFGLLESAKRMYKAFDKTTTFYKYIQAYVDGINDGVGSLGLLPPEFQILRVGWEEWTLYDSICFLKLLSFININDAFQEFIKTEFRDVYGKDISDILGDVGPDNQYDSAQTVMNEEELKLHTKLWDPEGFQKGKQFDAQDKTPDQRDITAHLKGELFPNDIVNWLLPSFSGSNAFVIHGNHTTTGKPFFASDPHLETQMPCLWYQAEMIFQNNGQEQTLIGGTFAGLPIVMSGRNRDVAWGLTILYSDSGDIYQEEIITQGKFRYYKYRDEYLEVKVVPEKIKVKGEEDVEVDIMYTHHGAILNSDRYTPKTRPNNTYYAFQTVVQLDDIKGFENIFVFQLQSTVKDVQESLKQLMYPNLGMVFADKRGDIGYLAVGRLVKRTENPDEGAYIKQGWLGNNEWEGYVSIDETPQMINPQKGYIVCSNNKYLPSNNKYHLGWNSQPTARGKRLNQLINEKIGRNEKFSLQDIIDIQNDVTDAYAKAGKPNIINLAKHAQQIYKDEFNLTSKETLSKAIKLLEGFDAKFERESIGASLYMKYEYFYTKKFAQDARQIDPVGVQNWGSHYLFDSFSYKNYEDMLGALSGNGNAEILSAKWCNVINPKHPCLYNIALALIEAYQSLTRQFGVDSSEWTWQKLHFQNFPHMPFKDTPLNFIFDRRFAYKGNRRTVHLSSPTLDNEDIFLTDASPNYKMVTSLDNREKSYFIIDSGISGNVLSPHYDDQQKLYEQNIYIEMKWGSSNLQQNKKHHQKLRNGRKSKQDI